jgi:hypothetical protein
MSEQKQIGIILQKKADESQDEKVIEALLNADTSNLSKKEAQKKLRNIIKEIDDND